MRGPDLPANVVPQAKLMTEVERYSSLLQEKEALNERWDEQNALLVESHERVIAELTEEYEAKLAEEALAKEALRQEKEGLEREFAEVKRQMEEDADCEIEDLKETYEQRLGAERETALRLKGENGIMRKKFQPWDSRHLRPPTCDVIMTSS
ncbi:WD repeat-containing protein 65 [Monoraphidium neglectum]|uniref:WD repeat-containing protein 65 n=1 Tax=Monoraphidium neglectum TaxID=145388 RepID=A0A0D2LNW8_9CHLO|nr:WD repeat-containing protein 65 [Monoraphidium neglectum]KIY91646.1 WD repeat-containing protein 65 [Monoraphidium neglectum]|eukprot:XP_013890666.1 WD repeat-containing protein 65 [Monoraphidium neglectum]